MIKEIKLEDLKVPSNTSRIVLTNISNGLNRFLYEGKELDASILPVSIPIAKIKRGAIKYNVNASTLNLKAIINKHIENGWEYKGIVENYSIFVKNEETKKVYIGDTARNILFYKYSTKGSLTLSEECSLEILPKTKEKVTIPEALTITHELGDVFNIYSLLPEGVKEVKILDVRAPYIKGIPEEYFEDRNYTLTVDFFTPEIERIIQCNKASDFTLKGFTGSHIVFKRENLGKQLSIPRVDTMYIDFSYSYDNMTFSKRSRVYLKIKETPIVEDKVQIPEAPINKIVYINNRNVRYIPYVTSKIIDIND